MVVANGAGGFAGFADCRLSTLARRKVPNAPSCDQPITVRTLSRDGRLYAYFVNDSPWPISLGMHVRLPAGVRVDDLSGAHAPAADRGQSMDAVAGTVRFDRRSVRL